MSKAILVLPEMPSSCSTCRFEKNNRCCITGEWINTIVRPVDKCPLRLMPEKRNQSAEELRDMPYADGIQDGFNLCLRAIEGSGEDD